MAEQQPLVNAQITDAVTQTNVKVLGEAPAEAVGLAIQALAHAVGLAMENATQAQGGMQQVNTSATAAIMAMVMAVKPGKTSKAHE